MRELWDYLKLSIFTHTPTPRGAGQGVRGARKRNPGRSPPENFSVLFCTFPPEIPLTPGNPYLILLHFLLQILFRYLVVPFSVPRIPKIVPKYVLGDAICTSHDNPR